MERRITLRELINKLEDLSEKGVNDNLPVIVNNDSDDYLYDISDIKFRLLYNRRGEERKYVSIDLYDNITPICLDDLDSRQIY